MENSTNENCCSPNTKTSSNIDCCSTNSNSSDKNTKMKKNFGFIIFGLALLIAITTAFKGSTKNEVSCSNTTLNVPTISITDFEWIQTNKKVAYIFLKGNDASENSKISLKVKSIVDELNEIEGSAYFLTLDVNNLNYQDVVSKLNIEDTPSIVVLGKNSSIINGENINSTKLIRAYDAVLISKSSCSPSEKKSCTEKSKASCNSEIKKSCTPKQKAACAGSKN